MGGANMDLLLAGVMGLAVYGIIAGIRMYRRDAKLPGDLAIALEVGATRTGAVGSGIDRLGMRWAPAVLRMMGPKAVNKKRRQIDMAGNPGGLTIDRYAARRAVYGGLGALGAFSMLMRGQIFLALLLVAFGLFWVEVGLWSAVRMRRDHIDRTLPDFLDVLAVVVSAGLGFRQALARVADKYEGPWADELRITLRQMDMGVSRREAFEQLRKRNDSEQVAMFVTTLQQGEEPRCTDRRDTDPDRQRHAAHRRPERPSEGGQGRSQGDLRGHHVPAARNAGAADRRLRLRSQHRLRVPRGRMTWTTRAVGRTVGGRWQAHVVPARQRPERTERRGASGDRRSRLTAGVRDPAERAPGDVPAGLRLPARHDRHSHTLRARSHRVGSGLMADRLGHPRHVHGFVRPVP